MAAIEAVHPPDAVLKTINPILRRALPTPLGRVIGDFMLLRFTGRKSGRRFAIPVSAHHLNGNLYAVMEAQWKYNFRGGADVEVSHRGRTSTMRGVLLTDAAQVADIVGRLATAYGAKKAQRMMGMKFDADRVPTREEWDEAVARIHISAVSLTPAR
ncbi:MAG: hypothetical protein PGN37_11615 [Mycobacterium kyogaense]|uniref:hypothetical protein n=1 Tax=Mycobacterium kyogaense TaxID=2212479 RepID=UPI002FFBCD30